jgi:site-specific DNA-adenine methylase
MKKNHFIFGYAGNKRQEVAMISAHLNLDDITTIVEPFCGTSALSCYLSILYPNRFIYRLNDIDSKLIELYYLLQNEEKTKKLEDDYNECIKDMTKEKYTDIINQGDMLGYVLSHKHYYMKVGTYSSNRKPSRGKFCDAAIVKFLRNETVEISNIDGEDVMKEYKQSPTTIIYLDPPYLKTYNNAHYANKKNFFGIYDYIESPDIKNYKSLIYLHVLENADLFNKIKFNFNLLYSEPKLYYLAGIRRKHKSVIHQLFKIDDTDFVRL